MILFYRKSATRKLQFW